MAFLGKIKSVFGFSNEDYEIDDNELPQRDATVTPIAQRRQQPAPAAHDEPADTPAQAPQQAEPRDDSPAWKLMPGKVAPK